MESKLGDKSRKEKRKEARLAKQQHRHLSRIEHQKSNKLKKDLKRQTSKKLKTKVNEISDRSENQNLVVCSERDGSKTNPSLPSKSEVKVDSLKNSTALKMTKENKGLKRKSKTKFEEYLQMDMKIGGISAEEDLELERKLAKKLKIKGGKLRGMDDGMDMLFEGIPSAIDTLTDKELQDAEEVVKDSKHKSTKKHKRKKLTNASMQGVEDGTEAGMEMGGMDDGMDMLFEGIPSTIDTLTDKELQDSEEVVKDSKHKSTKKRKRKKLTNALMQGVEDGTEADMVMGGSEPGMNSIVEVNKEDSSEKKPPAVTANVKYVAPHLRSRAGNEPEEYTQIRRQVRGLLNRLSESNVEPITQEISTILRSVSRSVGSQIISEEVLASCVGGPRGNEQYAAVFAAFVAGLACLVGIAFSAKLISSLAKSFEDEYLKEDNLSMRNLILLLSYLCIFGVCSSDLIYDFLIILSKRLMEIDVSTILTILQCCGMKLRSDDPAAMKDFIVSIQNRVAELKSPSGSTSGDQPMINNRRMEFMLETICDIKNNKKKSKEDPTQHTRIKKWLQKLRTEDILLRGLKWNQLLDPNKKGQWWLSGDVASTTANKVEELANTIDKEVLEAQKMLQLAAAQRMNTDSRRAIFCIIMSGEDYIDAFEKLLRLDLPGKQDREIMRVLVDCCLQEKVFNKYYTVLAAKLCNYDKNHKFTLQYCLWDHFKALESMELIRSKNLARFIAEMLITFSLSLAVLKTVDLSDPMQLTPKRIMHFRMLFDAIFEQPDSVVWNIFTRVAVAPELEDMRTGLEFFFKQYVLSSNKAFSVKFKVAKKALSNIAGILM